jgi:hypothetical protein
LEGGRWLLGTGTSPSTALSSTQAEFWEHLLDLQSIYYITDLPALLMTCMLHGVESAFDLSEPMAIYSDFIVFG